MRVSCDDELSIDQNPGPCLQLEREQICITASALLDHYTRAYLVIETSHAEDIAGIQAILELLNKFAVQPQVIFPQCRYMIKKLINQWSRRSVPHVAFIFRGRRGLLVVIVLVTIMKLLNILVQ